MSDDRDSTVEAPRQIGPYTIVGTLGEGGMGVVYEAEQSEPVKRKVALKLIRGGADFDDIAARFEAERQALAVMEHPFIAKVLDGGTTPGGSPYFVMEYVEGVPLTEYCDAAELSVPDRLRLFSDVCDAIQHAHQKGIIHRDLKPNNILVTEQAGSAHPKVIDFGIAKAAGVKLTEKTLATQMGAMMGTPAYMSPEQAEGTGLDIDTRTDVYALGVILYELLTGRVPLDPAELGFPRFLAKLVMDDTMAPTPSAQLTSDPEFATTVSNRRRTTPDQLKRRLTGDLDWIVMKAIETDRERRYGSARELAGDVGRVLRDEPVSARPPSATYRLEKFVRRNRAAVIAGVAAVLLLVAGVVASTIGFVRATRAEAIALAEGARARNEAATATEVSDFLTGLFESANPGFVGRSDVTARELLDQGVETIDDDLADQPLVQARLLEAMASAYEGVGELNQARDLKLRVLALREEAAGPRDPLVAESLEDLVVYLPRYSDNPETVASSPERLAMAERAFSIREEHYEDDPAAWGGSIGLLADLYQGRQRFQEAVDLLQMGVDRLTDELGPTEPVVLHLERRHGLTYANDGRWDAAIEILEPLLAKAESLNPPDTAQLLSALNNLAWAQGNGGQREASIPHLERLVEIERIRWDGVTPMELVDGQWNLALGYQEVERHQEAIDVWERVVADFAEVYGPEDITTVGYHQELAAAYLQAGRPAEAVEPLAVAARVQGQALDDDVSDRMFQWFIETLGLYGVALHDSGVEDPTADVLALAGDEPDRRHGGLQMYSQMIDWKVDPAYVVSIRDQVLDLLREIPVEDEQRSFDRLKWSHVLMTLPLLQLDDAEGLRALAPRWEAAVRQIAPGDNPWTLQSLRDLASVTYRGEPAFDEPPIPELQPDAIDFLERALAMRERMEGAGIHLIQHLVPLRHALLMAGREEEAAAVQARARTLLAARLAELEDMAATGELVEAERWNGNCWWGALAELPEVVMSACNAAVEGAIGDEVPRFYDSRGVARAVMGDLAGATEDFETYLSFRGPESAAGDQRTGWVEELQAGRNPLTGFTLGALSF